MENKRNDFSGFYTTNGYVISEGYNTVTCAANDIYSQYIRFGDIFFPQMNEMIRFCFKINKCSDNTDASCIMIGVYGFEDQSTFWICNDGSTCLEYTQPSNINEYYTEDYLENLDAKNNEIKCKFTAGDTVCITVDCCKGNVWVKINEQRTNEYVWGTQFIDSFQFLLNMTKQNDSISIIESHKVSNETKVNEYENILLQIEEKNAIIENLRNELQNMRHRKEHTNNANLKSKNMELQKRNYALITDNKMLKQELMHSQQKYQVLKIQNNTLKREMQQMNNSKSTQSEDAKIWLSYQDAKKLNMAHKETYLSEQDFVKVFGMNRNEFSKLKPWKQKRLKKNKGLF